MRASIARGSIDRALLTWILMLACLLGGIWGFLTIGRLEDPAFTIKTAVVSTAYPGASAAEVAREGHLVTIGIEPTSPAFVEKPDAVRAAQYVASGEFRWNAGMFVVRAATLLDLLAQWHHELAAGVRAIAASPERLDELWPGLTRIAIDHAVAEPAADAGHVVVVPAPFTWDDVGDFASLAELLPPVEGEPGLRVLGSVDDVTTIDASGIVAAAGGRRVAVVGIEDVVVIDTPDAVLVTTRSRAQDVKAVVDALKAQGRTDLT